MFCLSVMHLTLLEYCRNLHNYICKYILYTIVDVFCGNGFLRAMTLRR